MNTNELWELIQKCEVGFSFIGMIFAAYASFKLWRQHKAIKQLAQNAPKCDNFLDAVKSYEGVQTINPVALAISLVPSSPSIKNDVEVFLKAQKMSMDIEELNMNGLNSKEDIKKFKDDLIEKRHLFDLDGRTEVHLFVQGPIIAGILLGSTYSNWKPAKLYHKPNPSPPSIYEYWCPLVKD